MIWWELIRCREEYLNLLGYLRTEIKRICVKHTSVFHNDAMYYTNRSSDHKENRVQVFSIVVVSCNKTKLVSSIVSQSPYLIVDFVKIFIPFSKK